MIDHLGIRVRDYEQSKAFYLAALQPLGIGLIMEFGPEVTHHGWTCGLGSGGKPYFWIAVGETGQMHLAFSAETRAEVDAFYQAALDAGATDNGPPGPRPIYHPGYYGAFVIDPNGINLEAVCHAPG